MKISKETLNYAKKRLYVHTFGCRLNYTESVSIKRSCEELGFKVVESNKNSDIVVINTCTVTENGDKDTRQYINKVRRLNPNVEIALVGCQAEIERSRLAKTPNVKWVVGNARKMDLGSILKEGSREESRVIAPTIERKKFILPSSGIDYERTRANLKVQDGCDEFCSFCIIPYARGRARSREYTDILREGDVLTKSGHREIVLTGVNIGTYRDEDKLFIDVVKGLLDIPLLDRLRISSIEPTTISKELVSMMRYHQKFCSYLHIPVQSGSDKVLDIMNRNYTSDFFTKLVKNCYQEIPDVCLGTDVIVGFPGETKKEFDATYQLLDELPLAYFHVFSYSERTMAKSKNYKGQNARATIEKRSQSMRNLSRLKRTSYMENFLGKDMGVLFEQKKDDCWQGFTENYLKVKVKTSQNIHNQIYTARIEKIDGETLIGSLLPNSERN